MPDPNELVWSPAVQAWAQVVHAQHEPRCNQYCDGTEHYLGRKHLDSQPVQAGA